MGHSAGAQLAALLCTDESYLKAEGVRFEDMLRGCIPVDSDTNDVVVEVTEHGKWSAGDDPAVWRALSPCTHCAPGKQIPPFPIPRIQDLNAPGGERGSGDGVLRTPRQAQLLAASLRSAKVRVEVHAAARKTHSSLDADTGKEGDQITAVVESVYGFGASLATKSSLAWDLSVTATSHEMDDTDFLRLQCD